MMFCIFIKLIIFCLLALRITQSTVICSIWPELICDTSVIPIACSVISVVPAELASDIPIVIIWFVIISVVDSIIDGPPVGLARGIPSFLIFVILGVISVGIIGNSVDTFIQP